MRYLKFIAGIKNPSNTSIKVDDIEEGIVAGYQQMDAITLLLDRYEVVDAKDFSLEHISLDGGVLLYEDIFNSKFILVPETHPLWQTVQLAYNIQSIINSVGIGVCCRTSLVKFMQNLRDIIGEQIMDQIKGK